MNILFDINLNTLKIIPDNKVMEKLYNFEISLPNKQQIIDYKKKGKDKKIIDFIKSKKIEEIIDKIKNNISKIDYKIPLYDEYHRNIFLISRNNVYNRVVYQYYRFPNKELLKTLKDRYKYHNKKFSRIKSSGKERSLRDFKKTSKVHYTKDEKILKERELRKLGYMIEFMNSFNIEILEDTYIKTFYNYANEVGKNITVCLRPSFLPHFRHIKPYYTRSELINLGLNMELIEVSNKYYDQKEIMKLCDSIVKLDIPSDTLLKHQNYMIENNKLGIIQYYSLQGSFFMNEYLREMAPYKYKNDILEENIQSMWKLINEAPEFKNSYILYRFINTDNHLQNMKIGQNYITPSFLSTTRDPFYRPEEFKFGFILIKVKIPKNTKGVALCIESISHFPEEQEIILSPLSILKLEKKNENVPYFHTDEIYRSKINTLYEFTYIGKKPIKLVDRPILKDRSLVDFLTARKDSTITMEERISYFVNNYALPVYNFKTKIGENEYTIITEWYDSTDVYKKFYGARTDNGFSMYTIIDNYVGFTIELGEDTDGTFMYVNYYFKHSSINKTNPIKDIDFLYFISTVGYYFEIKTVYLYANYSSCGFKSDIMKLKEGKKSKYYGGNFCIDFYNYFKNNIKRYKDFDTIEINPVFKYYQLNRLKNINPEQILNKEDRDEIYQLYTKVYDGDKNIADFYVWLVDNNCGLINMFVEKMARLYKNNNIFDNPFNNDYYRIDIVAYLYNRKYIDEVPTFSEVKEIEGVQMLKISKYPRNEYRLYRDRNKRVPKK